MPTAGEKDSDCPVRRVVTLEFRLSELEIIVATFFEEALLAATAIRRPSGIPMVQSDRGGQFDSRRIQDVSPSVH